MSDNTNWIDLRSDTVTRPTPKMREAMAQSVVGDDVYGEDPTINQLEADGAAIMGKEAGLFVPSGTMGNTIGVKMHTEHGQEIICESRSHVFNYELAMSAWFSGCFARPVAAVNGILTWRDIEPHLRSVSPHWSPTGLISLENTHNMAGGTVTPVETIDEICDQAHRRGLKVHMDGARIFHAAEFLRIPVARIVQHVDSVMFCLSKGLGAPVGSLLVGTREAIDRGRLFRKRLGGGMRQGGVLAAPGLIALHEMSSRLGEDHENARLLARGLAEIEGVRIDPASVQTNIVIFDVTETGLTAEEMVGRLAGKRVLCNAVGPARIRFVTHYDVSRSQCEEAVAAMRQLAPQGSASR